METEPAYLEALDRQLLDQPEAMLVSQLDGFLTGIVVSPDLITPGRWIPLIWAGDEGNGEPDFESEEELQTFLNLVMTHYHAIIDALAHPGAYAPVLETDTRTDETLWEMWIDGFAQAMALSPDGWARIDGDDDAGCHAALKGIRTLRDFAEGNLALGEQEDADDEEDEQPEHLVHAVALEEFGHAVGEEDHQKPANDNGDRHDPHRGGGNIPFHRGECDGAEDGVE